MCGPGGDPPVGLLERPMDEDPMAVGQPRPEARSARDRRSIGPLVVRERTPSDQLSVGLERCVVWTVAKR
jgi:hypothetical protein